MLRAWPITTDFYVRYAWRILLGLAACLPVLAIGVNGAMSGSSNDVRQWLPAGFEETRQYDWFLEHFGSEELAVVSWPGCTLADERLDQLAERLAPYAEESPRAADASPSAAPAASQPKYFRNVITGRSALRELMAPPLNLTRDQALERLDGALVGPDRRTTGMVVTLSEAGAADRHRTLRTIRTAAARVPDLDPAQLRMGGPTVDSVSLDIESERARYGLAGLSVVLAALVAWLCLRSMKLVLVVIAVAIYATAVSVNILYFTGGQMNLVLVMMPTLVYVLTISAAIHLANYYRDAVASHGPRSGPFRAVAAGWFPCAIAASTTAVGLGSLAVSEVIPVKEFGIYSAAGTLASLPVLFLMLPSALQLWPVRHVAYVGEGHADDALALRPGRSPIGRRIARLMIRRRNRVSAVTLAVMVFAAFGLPRLETSVRLLNMFSPQAKIIQDYIWLEEHLGPLVPVEIVVRSQGEPRNIVDQLQLVTQIEQELENMPHVGGTMSAATYAPPLPGQGGIQSLLERRILERRLRDSRERLEQVHYLRDTSEGELWRISARVEALSDIDYGVFLDDVQKRLDPLLAAQSDEGTRYSAIYTGVVPLVYTAQRALLNDLTTSFLTAFLLVGLMLTIILRSVRAGLLSMIPNVFPAVVVFGMLGWTGRLVDIGSMMTASLALGIAVDDTTHFLMWFRRAKYQGMPRTAALELTYERTSGAMLQTTAVCGLGLLVFTFSGFVPTRNFAWMMSILLVAALVGDLLLLPAMLASRLGRHFERRTPEVSAGMEPTAVP